MFQKILTSMIALTVSSSIALAVPAPKNMETVSGFVERTAKDTNKSPEAIKEEMKKSLEALRARGNKEFSSEDIERVVEGKVELDPIKQDRMVKLMKNDAVFRSKVGLAPLRNSKVTKAGEDAFEATRTRPEGVKKVDVVAPGEKFSPMEKEVLALGRVKEFIGQSALEAVKNMPPEHYVVVKKLALILAKRVENGQLRKEVAEGIILDNAKSPKVLEGQMIAGEGVGEACMLMQAEAIESFAGGIHEGVLEGKDPESVTKAMGKFYAERFKQELDEGIARVCALASSGCKLFGKAIIDACAKLKAGHSG